MFVVVDGFTGCNTYVMSRMRLGCNILEHFRHPARNVFDCFRVPRPTARMQQGCNHQTCTDNDTFQDAVGMQEFPHPGASWPTFHKSQTKSREPFFCFFCSASWSASCLHPVCILGCRMQRRATRMQTLLHPMHPGNFNKPIKMVTNC